MKDASPCHPRLDPYALPIYFARYSRVYYANGDSLLVVPGDLSVEALAKSEKGDPNTPVRRLFNIL